MSPEERGGRGSACPGRPTCARARGRSDAGVRATQDELFECPFEVEGAASATPHLRAAYALGINIVVYAMSH